MWVFPLLAAGVAFAFAGMLIRRFALGGKLFQGVWAVALAMYAAASFAMFLGVLDGWSTAEFRVYWLLGAILNVPFLALGEIYLLARRRIVGDVLLLVLLFLTAFATSKVRTATLLPHFPLSEELPLGKDVFGDGTLPYRLAQYYAYPAYFLLLGGCFWSAWRMRERPELRDRFVGTLWIAVGATIVAAGSGVGAGLGVVPLFSASLAVGIAAMFWGFLRASRRSGTPPAPEPGRP